VVSAAGLEGHRVQSVLAARLLLFIFPISFFFLSSAHLVVCFPCSASDGEVEAGDLKWLRESRQARLCLGAGQQHDSGLSFLFIFAGFELM
jgi:hypothetical protein